MRTSRNFNHCCLWRFRVFILISCCFFVYGICGTIVFGFQKIGFTDLVGNNTKLFVRLLKIALLLPNYGDTTFCFIATVPLSVTKRFDYTKTIGRFRRNKKSPLGYEAEAVRSTSVKAKENFRGMQPILPQKAQFFR